MKVRNSIPFLVLLGLLGSSPAEIDLAASPAVTVHPRPDAGFEERWRWAENELESAGWVGYAVDMWSEPDLHFLSGNLTIRGSGGVWMKGAPLDEVIGKAVAAGTGSRAPLNEERPGHVRRPIAVLVALEPGGEVADVDVSDLAFPVDLEGRPLAWIGPASGDESFRLLTGLWKRAGGSEAKEDLVETVGLHERAETVEFLGRVVDSREEAAVREEAVEALAEQGSPRAVEILVRAAQSDPSMAVREEAVEALGESRAPGAEKALFDLARNARDRRLREEALDVLAEKDTPEARATIEDLLWNDPEVSVQEEAVDAVAEHGDAYALPILKRAARHHPRAAVREEAVEALAEKAAERVVQTLEDVVYQDQSATVREEALEALGELAGGEGLAVLVKVASTHPDRYMREEALDVLADLGEHDARARKALRMLGSG